MLSSGIAFMLNLVKAKGAHNAPHVEREVMYVDMTSMIRQNAKSSPLGVWVKVGLGQLSFFFDPDADHGTSASGLSTVVASTHGFVPIAGTSLLVSLNAYRRLEGVSRKRCLIQHTVAKTHGAKRRARSHWIGAQPSSASAKPGGPDLGEAHDVRCPHPDELGRLVLSGPFCEDGCSEAGVG